MDLREETIAILNKYGLRANKKLGQNFLINESIIYDIVKKAKKYLLDRGKVNEHRVCK